jgi:hypothetical protein
MILWMRMTLMIRRPVIRSIRKPLGREAAFLVKTLSRTQPRLQGRKQKEKERSWPRGRPPSLRLGPLRQSLNPKRRVLMR